MAGKKKILAVSTARLVIARAKRLEQWIHQLIEQAESKTIDPTRRSAALEELKALVPFAPSCFPPEVEEHFRAALVLRSRKRLQARYQRLLPHVRQLKRRLKDDHSESGALFDRTDEQGHLLSEELALEWTADLIAQLLTQQPSDWLIGRLSEWTGDSPEAVRRKVLKKG